MINTMFSIQIEEIMDISNGQMVFEYDRYSGAISGFEDRLFMANLYSIEEFEILDSGELNRISYFETSLGFSPRLYIYQNKLFYVNYRKNITDWYPNYFCRVFDVTQRPMVEIIEFELPEVITGFVPSFNFHGSHLYISFRVINGEEHDTYITIKYSIETYSFVSYIDPALGGAWVLIDDNTLLNMSVTDDDYYVLMFYHFENDQMSWLNSFNLSLHISESGYSYPHISDAHYVFAHSTGSVVVDISDVMNPVIVADIRINGINNIVEATYTGEFVIMSSQNKEIRVYQQNQGNDFTLLWVNPEEPFVGGGGKDIYVKDNFIFHQRGNDLIVFDLFTSSKLFRYYEKFNMTPFYYIVPQHDEFYFNWLNWNTFDFDIYAVLTNELVVSVRNNYKYPQHTYHFQIENEKLYVVLQRQNNYFFEIYDIIDNRGHIVNSFQLPRSSSYFILSGNILFLDTPNGIDVFNIVENQINHLDFLHAKLEENYSRNNSDFIITYVGRNVYFRNSSDYNNIFFSVLLPQNFGSISYIDSNYILVHSPSLPTDPTRTSYIYNYNLMENSISLFHTFPMQLVKSTYAFNGVVTDNAYWKETSDYFSILNNELVTIGQKEDRNREIWNTFFYPEINKMVQVAMSGIWVYDIEFEEYVSDGDIVVLPMRNELLGNYPNPFNPETTMSFILQEDAHVKIDIYNIRGQKVKSLVNDFKTSGNHQITWNGKDNSNRDASSGIYFYQMATKDFVQTKKMILMK